MGLGNRYRTAWLLIACSIASVPVGSPQAQPVRDAQPAQNTQVLDAVLRDLITYNRVDKPLSLSHAPREVFFNVHTVPKGATDILNPLRHQKVWARMSRQEQAAAEEAAGQIKDRPASRRAFSNYQPGDRRIHAVFGPAKPRNSAPYFAMFPVQAAVPGYSRDGTIAVVRLNFPEIFHPSQGAYVLQKKDNQWKVLYCAFITLA